MFFSKFSKWKQDRDQAACLLRGGADSGPQRSFASAWQRTVCGAGSFYELLFAGCAISREVLPEIGWFSSTQEVCAGRRDLCQNAVAPLTWPYACRLFADAKCKKREAPSEGPSVDENHPISGRSPQFFCHGSSQASRAAPRGRNTATPSRFICKRRQTRCCELELYQDPRSWCRAQHR